MCAQAAQDIRLGLGSAPSLWH